MKSCRAARASGSPPVKCTCRTPNFAASEKTRSQSFLGNSALAEASSMGFEQYTQCRGQRCVISAMRASGFESIRNQANIKNQDIRNQDVRNQDVRNQRCVCRAIARESDKRPRG